VADLKFTGHGCAISQASASMLTTKGERQGANGSTSHFSARFSKSDYGGTERAARFVRRPSSPGGVRKFPQRVKCALLPCRAIEKALEQTTSESSVSTESEA
jgi:nitrogen fixation NifU-like protein